VTTAPPNIPAELPALPKPPVPARARFDAQVVSNRFICREHYLLRIRIDPTGPIFPATEPGQFIQLGCRTPDGQINAEQLMGTETEWSPSCPPQLHQPELCDRLAMLRRPFSLAGRGEEDIKVDGKTQQCTWIEVIHRVVGTGTQWLSELNEGDAVDLIGPLGNRFDLPADKSIGLMVGGGVGLPPMFYLAQHMKQAGWSGIGFVGALTRDLLAVTFDDKVIPANDGSAAKSVVEFAKESFDSVVTTDDGSLGLKGRITAGLEKQLETMSADEHAQTVIFTCGPEPMMHAVATLGEKYGITCQVCLEQAMACGMGTCQSCIVKIESQDKPHGHLEDGRPWRFKLACFDGPVFPSTEVIW
jgi:dihydroorotate dehydrogenase electron transfer subunit